MKRFLFFILTFAFTVYGQITYQGPASGSVSSGVTVSTDTYGKNASDVSQKPKLFVNPEIEDIQGEDNSEIIAEEGSNVLPLFSKGKNISEFADSVFIIEEFQGAPHRNSIPPDPYLAVGPNHIIHVVNTYFRITDKEGNLLKDVSASSWFHSVYGAASPFDPKVIYDQFANRWIMVWLDMNETTSEAFYLISVSDDENPLGTWYNWALPSNVNGSTPTGGWADYQGVGYDDKALYITSNLFSFSGSYQGTRIRIIDKNYLYAGSAGEVYWTDLWRITYPASSYSCFGIRPAIMYNSDADGKYYFADHSPYTTANNVGVFILENPLTNPVLEGYTVSVTAYTTPPLAQQLGGGALAIESGGKNLRFEPLVLDGKLYLTHSVRSGSKSGIHFVKIDLNDLTADDDFVFADGEHYYFYPAIAIDENNNVFFTYSRSSESEYIGAGFFVYSPSGAYSNDMLFEPGYGNYVVDYGTGRNRWGDYSGAWKDPADPKTVWFATEHVASTNHWGVRLAGVRACPFDEATAYFSTDSIYFGQIEIGNVSDIYNLTIKNYGAENLLISSVAHNVEDIHINDDVTFPVEIAPYDSLVIRMQFVPTEDTLYNDMLSFISGSNVIKNVKLTAEGYSIRETEKYAMYATTGSSSNGLLTKINLSTGLAEEIGPTNYKPVRSVTINPSTNILFALEGRSNNTSPVVLRISSKDGSAFPYSTLDKAFDAFAFDNNGILYGTGTDSKLYTIDLESGLSTYVADLPLRCAAITFHHVTNELYATSRSSSSRDLVVTINVSTGDTTHVGRTGRNKTMFGLAFDNNNNLFAVEGTDFQVSNFIQINLETGEGNLIGSTDVKGIAGLAFAMGGFVGVEDNIGTIKEFSLEQNYPNPFNPETTIKYTLARNSDVTLKIFDVLGREIVTLVNSSQTAGEHSVKFNAENLASGLYIYRLQADGFVASKKMLLLK